MSGSADDLIDWRDGQPVSRSFGDVYFSRESGLAEARHVFVAGNRLHERWAGLSPRARFTIGETGFGTGLNFAAAWALWDAVAPPGARLRYVSVEGHPLPRKEVARALAMWPELARYREALLAQWTDIAPGWHRFVFGAGRVLLTVLCGDVRTVLPQLDGSIDAWFLDGFAPAKNPAMWQPDVFFHAARLSVPGATCATFTVAGEVRRGLEAAGFAVEKAPGFGRKREMLQGVLRAPPRRQWHAPWFARPARYTGERAAIVIGAGLAGTSSARSLADRGWRVTLVDRHATLAAEASGNPLGTLYARLSPHATALSALAVAGLEYTARTLPLLGLAPGVDFASCGVLELEHDEPGRKRHVRLAAQRWPAGFLVRLGAADAAARAGIGLQSGALFFPRAGWVRPPALCRALAAHSSIQSLLGRSALGLRFSGGTWEVRDATGPVASAPVVVLAASGASTAFAETAHLPLRLIRGQLTLVPGTPGSEALRTVLCGEGYVAPSVEGFHSLGATHKFRDLSTAVTVAEHAENLLKLAALAPSLYRVLGAGVLDPGRLDGRAAIRCSSPDYLPIIGPVADAARFTATYARLAHDATLEIDAPAPWIEGLYVNTAHGSRGLVTAPLSGELLAATLEDEPFPLPRRVVEAIHPSRFLLRSLIRSR